MQQQAGELEQTDTKLTCHMDNIKYKYKWTKSMMCLPLMSKKRFAGKWLHCKRNTLA